MKKLTFLLIIFLLFDPCYPQGVTVQNSWKAAQSKEEKVSIYGNYLMSARRNWAFLEELENKGYPYVETLREHLAIEAFVGDTNRRKEFVERAMTFTEMFPIAAPHLGLTVMRHVHKGAPEMEELIVVLAERAALYSQNHARQIAHHIATQYMIMYTDIVGVDPWLDRYLAWGGDSSWGMIRTVKLATGEFQANNYGKVMPYFTLRDLDGREVSFSEFYGKFVFISFWASWCGPCRATMPHMRSAHKKFKNAPIIFLNISIDRDDDAWKRAAVGPFFEAPWQHLTANGTTMARDFSVRSVPRKIILDPERRLVADHIIGTTINTQLGRLAKKHDWEL